MRFFSKTKNIDYLKIGNQELANSNYELAINAYKKKIELTPSSISGYIALGYVYSEQERWRDSIVPLEKAIDLVRDNDGAYFMLGRSYYNLGNWVKAEFNWRCAINLSSNIQELYEKYIFLLFRMGRKNDALLLINGSIEKFPEEYIFYIFLEI